VSQDGSSPAEGVVAELGVPARVLVEILVESLYALAAAGEVEAACRLAGQACVAVRRTDQTSERRFDVLLHRLTPKLTW
jgi:hypothetical protein